MSHHKALHLTILMAKMSEELYKIVFEQTA